MAAGGATGRGGSSGGPGDAFAGAAASNPLLAWLVTTSGGILLFLFLLRRGTRHDDDRPGALVFAGATATPPRSQTVTRSSPRPPSQGASPTSGSVAATGVAAPKRTRRSAATRARSATAPPAPTPNEGGSPSATTDKTKGGARAANVFDKAARKGVERATVSYRRVRISSEPDDVRSVELGRLDRGDEVEILDSHEGFLKVRTSNDVTGWIKRHTIV